MKKPVVAIVSGGMDSVTLLYKLLKDGENVRLTVLNNGLVIHNNVTLPGPTGGALDDKVDEPGPLLLQDHGDFVAYRNIWVVHLPLEGSKEYDPR